MSSHATAAIGEFALPKGGEAALRRQPVDSDLCEDWDFETPTIDSLLAMIDDLNARGTEGKIEVRISKKQFYLRALVETEPTSWHQLIGAMFRTAGEVGAHGQLRMCEVWDYTDVDEVVALELADGVVREIELSEDEVEATLFEALELIE